MVAYINLKNYQKIDQNAENTHGNMSQILSSPNLDFQRDKSENYKKFDRNIEIDKVNNFIYFTGYNSLIKSKLDDLETVQKALLPC